MTLSWYLGIWLSLTKKIKPIFVGWERGRRTIFSHDDYYSIQQALIHPLYSSKISSSPLNHHWNCSYLSVCIPYSTTRTVFWVFITCGEPDFHAPKTSGQKDGEAEESIAASYHISFSPTSTLKAPTFSRTSFASSYRNFHNLNWSTSCVSSSGHVLLRVRQTWPTQNVILPLRELSRSRGGSDKLPHFHRGRHMSIYGGALVHLERDSEFETDDEEENAILCVINYFDWVHNCTLDFRLELFQRCAITMTLLM